MHPLQKNTSCWFLTLIHEEKLPDVGVEILDRLAVHPPVIHEVQVESLANYTSF